MLFQIVKCMASTSYWSFYKFEVDNHLALTMKLTLLTEKLKAMGNHTSSHLSMDKSYATNSQEIARMAQYLDQLNNNPDDISKTLK